LGRRKSIPIVIDSNENAIGRPYEKKLRSFAEKHKQVVEVYSLEAGDFLIGNILIEYKTPSDFISYQDGALRIFNQVRRLKQIREEGFHPMVVIVGTFAGLIKRHGGKKFYSRILPQLYGVMNRIILKDGIPILWFRTANEFHIWLEGVLKGQLSSHNRVAYSLRNTPKRISSLEEEINYFLQGIRGVGGVKSKKIISEGEDTLIQTLNTIAFAGIDGNREKLIKWQEILGLRTFDHIRKLLTIPLNEIKNIKEE